MPSLVLLATVVVYRAGCEGMRGALTLLYGRVGPISQMGIAVELTLEAWVWISQL